MINCFEKLKNVSLALLLVIGSHVQAVVEREIAIVTASYNNIKWFKENLDSVFAQEYSNFRLYYTDDCSTDGTYQAVKDYIKERGFADRVTLIGNEVRVGALANQYKAIHQCNDKAIIVILDGDDWFAHQYVLKRVNEIYSNENIWLTYGQFVEYPSNVHGFCAPMPDHVVRNNDFRHYSDIPSHLRTFYAGLFKRIKIEDLMFEGSFMRMTGDMAAMIPMIEMACDHFKFVPEVLLVYNGANDLNDHKVSKDLQRRIDLYIRSRPKYPKLTALF